MSLLVHVEPYIIVPTEVARELGVDLQKTYRRGRYYIDLKTTYEVCLLDLEDRPVVCLECDLYAEDGLNRILIPMEYMEAADITISTGRKSWRVENRTDWIKSVLEVKEIVESLDRQILRFTPIYDIMEKLEKT